MAVDESPEVARRELLRWFTDVYRNPPGTDLCGIHGTPEQVRERLEELVGMGANHLLLNPVSRYTEQVEALAEVVGLEMSARPDHPTRSKQQVAAHWDRRAAHFDEDFGHSIGSPAERAAWDRILDLVIPPAGAARSTRSMSAAAPGF